MKISAFSRTYNGRKVLDFSGIELESGKIYAVIGANGSGKSTFARILAGIEMADRKGRLVDRSIGYMPQKNYAFRMSVRANLMLNGDDEARAERLMEALQLGHLAQKRADRLSGGESARMALARLMMGRYELVILDEPCAAMDMETTLLAEELIADYVKESGCALILVTHSLQQARRLSRQAMFFHKGELIEAGDAKTVLNAPTEALTRKFLDFYGT